MWRILLASVVVVHLMVVFGNAMALFVLPFTQPWEVALPLCSFIFWISCNKGGMCPMTAIENKVRKQLDMPEIRGFVKHYIIKPVFKLKRKLRK